MSCRGWQEPGGGKAKSGLQLPACQVKKLHPQPESLHPWGSVTTRLLQVTPHSCNNNPNPHPGAACSGQSQNLAAEPVCNRSGNTFGEHGFFPSTCFQMLGVTGLHYDREEQLQSKRPVSYLLRVRDVHRSQNLLRFQVCARQPSKKMSVEGNLPCAFCG